MFVIGKMKDSEHLEAAGEFFEVAASAKTSPVRAQNYFYACINYIEYVLAKSADEHSFSHEDRNSRMMIAKASFDNADVRAYDELITLRNLSGYRGRNGHTVEEIRKIAQRFREKALKLVA